MSAIYGVVGPIENSIRNELLARWGSRYATYSVENVNSQTVASASFGCALQVFTPSASTEHLPLYYPEAELFCTADIVLDNRDELLKELALPADTPDGAILLHSYIAYGEQCFARLKGLFSCAIYNAKENSLLLATDPFAQRCLFYHRRSGVVYFSTLLFPLLDETELSFDCNERWLIDEITLRSPQMITEPKETAVNAVYKLVPGTYIRFDLTSNTMQEVRYYDPLHAVPVDASITPEKSESMIRELMNSVISRITANPFPIGCQLSADLDSSTVACIAAKQLSEQQRTLLSYTSIPLKEAQLPTTGYNLYDESAGVRTICEAYPNIIPTFLDTAGRNYLDEIDYFVDTWELPCKSEQNAVWGDEICHQAAADGCKILLAGSTGNCTISAGSIPDMIYDCLCHLHVRKAVKISRALYHYGASRKLTLRNMRRAWKDHYLWYFNSSAKNHYRDTLSRPEIGENYKLNKRFHQLLHRHPFTTRKQYREYIYLINANAQIGEIDTKYSLTHGILIRDPMRTTEIVEFCLKLSMDCFTNEDYDRRLVRVGMEGIVPKAIRLDVRHRGAQSGDNEYRLSKRWDSRLSDLHTSLHTKAALHFLAEDRIDSMLSQVNSDNIAENFNQARMLVDAYTFAKYLERLKASPQNLP